MTTHAASISPSTSASLINHQHNILLISQPEEQRESHSERNNTYLKSHHASFESVVDYVSSASSSSSVISSSTHSSVEESQGNTLRQAIVDINLAYVNRRSASPNVRRYSRSSPVRGRFRSYTASHYGSRHEKHRRSSLTSDAPHSSSRHRFHERVKSTHKLSASRKRPHRSRSRSYGRSRSRKRSATCSSFSCSSESKSRLHSSAGSRSSSYESKPYLSKHQSQRRKYAERRPKNAYPPSAKLMKGYLNPSLQRMMSTYSASPILLPPHLLMNNYHALAAAHQQLLGSAIMLRAPTSSQLDSQLNPMQRRSLWVGNLQPWTTEADVHELFSEYGVIRSVRLMLDKHCAFVNFAQCNEATKALASLQGHELHGEELRIRFTSEPGLWRPEDTAGPYAYDPTTEIISSLSTAAVEGVPSSSSFEVGIDSATKEEPVNAVIPSVATVNLSDSSKNAMVVVSHNGVKSTPVMPVKPFMRQVESSREKGWIEPLCTLIVENLDSGAMPSEETVCSIFAEYGALRSVLLDSSASCAYITYDRSDSAALALDKLSGEALFGRAQSCVRYSTPRPAALEAMLEWDEHENAVSMNYAAALAAWAAAASLHNLGQSHAASLWVGSVPSKTTDDELTALFGLYGPVSSVRILRDRHCAFVNFLDSDAAHCAMQALDNFLLHDRVLKVRPAIPGGARARY